MFAGLQDLGVANGEDLKETLTNCTEPLKAIEQFQTENGVLLPSLQSALPFLDLHGTPRLEFHQSVFDELRDKLLERVSGIASEGKAEERYKKLEDLLEKSFSLVKMPSLQPVVMCVMKHLPKVPEKKLKLVMADKELYRACAVEVKRQIWQDNQALFGDEVSPLLKQYILEKENALFSTELSVLHNFFSPSPKARRQGEVVQKLTQMVGKNVKLYDMVLQFLRTLFLRTRNVHYCTLRAELLMSLHDLDVSDICSVDPCHKFTWCLDACIRERFVDSKRARELQGFLDGVKKGQEQVLGDLSMILCDPFAINTLSLSTVRHLQELVGQETLPRDSPDLLLLLRLLALGQGAWDMIDSQVFKEPKMEVELITRFLPTLMSLVVDDHAFSVDQKLPAEDRAPVSYPNTLPETFTKCACGAVGGVTPVGCVSVLRLSGPTPQVPAGAAHGLRGGAVLRAAHRQAAEQERTAAPAAWARGDLQRPGLRRHLPPPADGEPGAAGGRVCLGRLLQQPLRGLPPHGLAKEGERAAARPAAAAASAPPRGPVQAAGPAEGAGAHRPERGGGEGALLPAGREAGAARPSEAQPGPGRRDPGARAAAARRARPHWALTLPLELLGGRTGCRCPWRQEERPRGPDVAGTVSLGGRWAASGDRWRAEPSPQGHPMAGCLPLHLSPARTVWSAALAGGPPALPGSCPARWVPAAVAEPAGQQLRKHPPFSRGEKTGHGGFWAGGGAGRTGRRDPGSLAPSEDLRADTGSLQPGDPRAGSCSSPGQQHPAADASPSRCLSLPVEWCAAAPPGQVGGRCCTW